MDLIANIKQKKFTNRFRGFDVKEVDDFLNEIIKEVEILNGTIKKLTKKNYELSVENEGYKKREENFKIVIVKSQKILDKMNEQAKKKAETITAQAEVEAEKILNKAHNRLYQLHNDIIELKRQRIQLEMQISSVLDTHLKMLEITRKENKGTDEKDSNLKFIKQA